jgi:hypothetical protein
VSTPLRHMLLLAVTALVVPTLALAAPPPTESLVVDDTYVYAAGTDGNPCPFQVTYHNEGTFLITTHLDSSGEVVRQFARGIDFLETYSASGKSISSRTPATVHFDAATNTIIGTGNQRHFTIPGSGILYAQAGRVLIDLDTGTSSSTGLNIPQGDAFCSAFAA